MSKNNKAGDVSPTSVTHRESPVNEIDMDLTRMSDHKGVDAQLKNAQEAHHQSPSPVAQLINKHGQTTVIQNNTMLAEAISKLKESHVFMHPDIQGGKPMIIEPGMRLGMNKRGELGVSTGERY